MSKTAVITARLDAETLALVDKVAKAQGRSRSWFAAEAIRRIAESEADFLAFVQEGIDAADRGELTPHDEVMAKLDGMIAKHRARCD
jgi:predicted transcriptional regulator